MVRLLNVYQHLEHPKMAAIIAQLTRANRERKKRVRIESAKCMYEIPPFDERYALF